MIIIDILGSLPDWGAMIASVAGLILLYSTLSSQLKVQQLQQAITEVEIRKYLDEIKPNLEAKMTIVHSDNYQNVYQVQITPVDVVPEKLQYVFDQPPIGFKDLSPHNGDFTNWNFDLKGSVYIRFKWDELYHEQGLVAGLKCYVYDKIGTKYWINFLIMENQTGPLRKAGPVLSSYPALMNVLK